MRKILVGITVAGLLGIATAAVATGDWEDYKDDFEHVTYSGSVGSLDWTSSPWIEIGEMPGYEGPSNQEGRVHVGPEEGCFEGSCLHIYNPLPALQTVGAKRFADLSMFTQADICYALTAHGTGLPLIEGTLKVQVTTDGGANWMTIDQVSMTELNDEMLHQNRDLTPYISEGFGIKFVVEGLSGGEAHVDEVQIKGLVEWTTTTSTTVKATTTTRPPTTTNPPTTSTAPPTTSTTLRASTTSTTVRSDSTTSTTVAESTTTTAQLVLFPPGGGPPEGSGLRDSAAGIQADFESGLHGGMDMMDAEVLGVELKPDFSMAVEVFEASWIWMIGLALVIATAIVTGLDRRRTMRGLQAT